MVRCVALLVGVACVLSPRAWAVPTTLCAPSPQPGAPPLCVVPPKLSLQSAGPFSVQGGPDYAVLCEPSITAFSCAPDPGDAFSCALTDQASPVTVNLCAAPSLALLYSPC